MTIKKTTRANGVKVYTLFVNGKPKAQAHKIQLLKNYILTN